MDHPRLSLPAVVPATAATATHLCLTLAPRLRFLHCVTLLSARRTGRVSPLSLCGHLHCHTKLSGSPRHCSQKHGRIYVNLVSALRDMLRNGKRCGPN